MRSWWLNGALAVTLAVVVGLLIWDSQSSSGAAVRPTVIDAGPGLATTGDVAAVSAQPRTVTPYEGLGAWIDAFDYSPPYSNGAPPLGPNVVDEMADHGVETLFVQAARIDQRSPDVLEDRWLLAELLLRADAADIDVVGWYLPLWGDDGADLAHLLAISEFEFMGHRFDGVAVDIEWNQDGLEPAERSRRLVQLSTELHDAVGEDALGAIVLPPVLTEVVNDQFWPEFPWQQIAPLYDVWLPMSYWSFRSNESGYGDGYNYNAESTTRLRNNIGDPAALVHGIGGIGGVDGIDDPLNPEEPLAQLADLDLFAQSLADTGSVGGSIYDWRTLEPAARQRMQQLFTEGVAAELPPG